MVFYGPHDHRDTEYSSILIENLTSHRHGVVRKDIALLPAPLPDCYRSVTARWFVENVIELCL